LSGIRLWKGDICDLQVDAIVVPATPMLWMTSGPSVAVKQRGGHGIEFEAVAMAPQPTGSAVATGAGSLGCRHVIHAVSLGPDRRTSAAAIDGATRAAVRLADQLDLHVVALPALGSPLGGVPLADCARIMVRAIHEMLAECPAIDEVVIALRGPRTYAAFRDEIGSLSVLRAIPIVPGAKEGLVGVMAPPQDSPAERSLSVSGPPVGPAEGVGSASGAPGGKAAR
jgi:O-acetyl-ADP-ribose deacetylase